MKNDDTKVEEVEASLDGELYKVKWKQALNFASNHRWYATANALSEEGPQRDIDYDSLMQELGEGDCHARDDEGRYRLQHKSVPGKYDEKDITTCAWCGKTL